MRLRSLLAGVVMAGALPAPAFGAPAWLPAHDLSAAGGAATGQQIAVDTAGNVIAVWERDGAIQAATRPVGGSWTAARDLSSVGTGARVAVDPGGEAIAVWERDGRVQAATRPAGGDWTAAQQLSPPGDAAGPHVAIGPAGAAVVTWSRFNGTNWIAQARTRSPGGSWSGSEELSAPGQDAAPADVGIDARGNAVAVWMRNDGSNWLVQTASREVAQQQWGAVRTLSAAGQDSSGAQVAVDPAGNAIAVWSRDNGTNVIVQVASRPASGEWTSAQNRSAGGRDAWGPQVAFDAAGNAAVAWHRSNGSHAIAQVVSRPAGGTWTSAQNLSAPGQDAAGTQLAINAAGDAIAAWVRSDWSTFAVVQAAVRPAGGDWTTEREISGNGVNPQVALDAAGNGVAIWESATTRPVVQAAGYDAAGPQMRISAESAGLELSASASALDAWSPIGSVRWDLGDGTTATGTTVSHVYATAGDYTVTVTASDTLGFTSSARATIHVDAPPPPPAIVAPARTAVPAPATKATEWVTVTLRRTLRVPGRRAKGCRGQVLATLKAGRTRLDTKAVRLDRRCRYTARFRVERSRLNGARTVTVTIRFPGNRYLRATPTRTYRVKV